MNIKLLTEHYLEFLSLNGGRRGFLSLYLSKCHIVGNHMSRLICVAAIVVCLILTVPWVGL